MNLVITALTGAKIYNTAIPMTIASIIFIILALISIILLGNGKWVAGSIFLFLSIINGAILYFMYTAVTQI